MKTNGNASLPPWGELEGGCNGNASLPPWGELEGGQTLYDGENVIEMNKDLEAGGAGAGTAPPRGTLLVPQEGRHAARGYGHALPQPHTARASPQRHRPPARLPRLLLGRGAQPLALLRPHPIHWV